MRRFNAWTVGLVIAAVVIGCGPGKEMPDAMPGQKEHTGPPPDPLGPAATASDPAAKAVLERAVKVITENVPGGLEKAKIARSVSAGGMQLSQTGDMTKMERTIEAIWPDRVLVVNAFKDDRLQTANLTVTFYLNGTEGWKKEGLTLDQGNTTELGQIIRNDITAQYWLMLGPTLADPRGVAFDLKKDSTGSTVKLAIPNLPVFRVTFEEKSGLPIRVEYYPAEQQQRPHKVLTMSDHKPAGGLVLPGKLELTQNDRLVERWATVNWEFPPTIDPTHFDPPKQ